MHRFSFLRLTWMLGMLLSLGTAAMALQILGILVLPASDMLHVQLYMVLLGGSLLCFAHLLWRGLGLRLVSLIALALGVCMLAMYLFPVNNATSPLLMQIFFAGRAPFGLLLLLYIHRIPIVFRLYGVAPLLTTPLFFLLQYNLYPSQLLTQFNLDPVEATRLSFGAIEVASAVLMAGLFGWSLWQARSQAAITPEEMAADETGAMP